METPTTPTLAVHINRPEKSMWLINNPTDDFRGGRWESFATAKQLKKYDDVVREQEVYSLAEIGVKFGDQESLVDQMQQMVDEATLKLSELGEKPSFEGRQSEARKLVDCLNNIGEIFQYDPNTGNAQISTMINDKDKKTATEETLLVGYKENALILFLERKKSDNESNLHITIPLGNDDEDIPHREATVTLGTGEFKNVNFSEASDAIASTFNSASLKFEAQIADLKTTSEAFVATFEDKK